MRAAVSVLTIVILFAHAGLGCCAHHVHACGHTHDPLGFPGDGIPDVTDSHGHADGDCSPAGTKHDQRDDCRGTKCDFGRRVNEQVVRFDPVLDQPMGLPTSAWRVPVADEHRAQERCTGGSCLLPTRLHLLNQVMLI